MKTTTSLYIAQHQADGAAAISQVLKTDQRFAQEVDCKALLGYAQRTGVDVRLDVTLNHPSTPALLALGIKRFVEAARSGIPWHLEEVDVATTFRQWLGGMVQLYQNAAAQAGPEVLLGLRPQDVADLVEKAGGDYYDRLEPEQVQAELDRLARMQAHGALWTAWRDATVAINRDLQSYTGNSPEFTLAGLVDRLRADLGLAE